MSDAKKKEALMNACSHAAAKMRGIGQNASARSLEKLEQEIEYVEYDACAVLCDALAGRVSQ